MAEIEFELIFALPEDDHDAFDLMDAVFEVGFEDAIVGTGVPGMIGIALEAVSDHAEDAILDAARAIQKQLPAGSILREVRPDLVSLADVAKRLEVTRQSLQKRKMPPASQGGLFRMEEVAVVIMDAAEGKGAGARKGRFAVGKAGKWLSAGKPARRVNAGLAVGAIDGATLEVREDAKQFIYADKLETDVQSSAGAA
ncbi:hypothetical protein M8756_05265 [Lutimaribacter sp. EGI FJ00015]|uniref:Uncharacterized protein n=1 Tax=Lutimaribacter degradans TaxID=2945989 RepID=A0ACC5ZTE6_9RHOB|nr:hypothetical protein [Lutimaribacter sp. EGI FJ00013]MCM2561581.1 hypothetical protein [Lutimaribacter sp. EGI FJ00013]MCO0612708.1 hypothetical protein [Lutimaribacter sp. EGI FJ00015]MCO0635366.1 hypothetical protein [Lutimaribacter sp. EGI FJ00014]